MKGDVPSPSLYQQDASIRVENQPKKNQTFQSWSTKNQNNPDPEKPAWEKPTEYRPGKKLKATWKSGFI